MLLSPLQTLPGNETSGWATVHLGTWGLGMPTGSRTRAEPTFLVQASPHWSMGGSLFGVTTGGGGPMLEKEFGVPEIEKTYKIWPFGDKSCPFGGCQRAGVALAW